MTEREPQPSDEVCLKLYLLLAEEEFYGHSGQYSVLKSIDTKGKASARNVLILGSIITSLEILAGATSANGPEVLVFCVAAMITTYLTMNAAENRQRLTIYHEMRQYRLTR